MPAMADNYLENRYEDYLARKLKKEAERRRDFRRRLEEYRKSLESARITSEGDVQKIKESPDIEVITARRSELHAVAVEQDVVRL